MPSDTTFFTPFTTYAEFTPLLLLTLRATYHYYYAAIRLLFRHLLPYHVCNYFTPDAIIIIITPLTFIDAFHIRWRHYHFAHLFIITPLLS